jgi:predicted nucleic acid-binding protein
MSEAIHLDTNYLVYFAAGSHTQVSANVMNWIAGNRGLYVSAMAWAEFQCGPLSMRDVEAAEDMIHGVLPVSEGQAKRAGWLFQMTGRRSRSLPDCLIAACAMEHDALLATANREDFERFVEFGLRLA